MVSRIHKAGSYLLSGTLLVAVALLASSSTPAFGDAAQVSTLLRQARSSAAQLQGDAVQMESYSNSRLSWESHAHQINLIKEHINRSGKILSDLHNARDGAAEWQQDAIDKISPLLQEMASNTEAIINHLNDRKQTWHPEYVGYLKSNAELSTELSKLIGDYVDYDSAKARTQSVARKLGISGS